jgi:predicted nucleic acid-binding protein
MYANDRFSRRQFGQAGTRTDWIAGKVGASPGGAQSAHRKGERSSIGSPRRLAAGFRSASSAAVRTGVILVDTSVWVDHLRQVNATLVQRLNDGLVLSHPMVVGELAVGNLRRRQPTLVELQELLSTEVATDAEVLAFIERFRLFGLGIGYVDCHLLAATMLTPGATIWTLDKRLSQTARQIGLEAENRG